MTIVYLMLGVLILAIGYLGFWLRKSGRQNLSEEMGQVLNQIFPEVLKNANQQLITMADQKIGTDFTNKKEAIEKMVKQVLDELAKNQHKLETAERDRVGSFNGLKEAIENNQKLTQQLRATTEGLKSVLSNNQMRGAFGEKVAEDLLKQSGFVIGVDYSKQETEGTSRPDFTIYLPDKTKVNIDSKFPYANILKMSETDDQSQKTQYLKLFEQDIKKKIAEVTSRDYIDPGKNTVDFVVVFIPNEMIFSFIYEKFPNLLEEAFAKKVVFAGPFSFVAILRMVRQAYDNFRYQQDVVEIIGQIRQFEKEFARYNEEFGKIGEKIEALAKTYDTVNTTRTRKLLRAVDKVALPA